MEDLKNFTKRVFNKAKGTSGPQTPPGVKTSVPPHATTAGSGSEKKHPKKIRDFADSDDEDYEDEHDDDNLKDDIGATYSAAGGSTQNTTRSSNSAGSNEGVGGAVARGLLALRRKKKGRAGESNMFTQIVSKFSKMLNQTSGQAEFESQAQEGQ